MIHAVLKHCFFFNQTDVVELTEFYTTMIGILWHPKAIFIRNCQRNSLRSLLTTTILCLHWIQFWKWNFRSTQSKWIFLSPNIRYNLRINTVAVLILILGILDGKRSLLIEIKLSVVYPPCSSSSSSSRSNLILHMKFEKKTCVIWDFNSSRHQPLSRIEI